MTSRRRIRFLIALLCFVMLFSVSLTAFAGCYQPGDPVIVVTPTYNEGETLYTTSAVGVYSGPGRNYPMISTIPAGFRVKRVSVYGEYSMIEALDAPGYKAYVESAYLTPYNPYPVYPNYYPYYNYRYYNPCYCY